MEISGFTDSERTTIVVLNRNGLQIDAVDAANVDCDHCIAFRICAFAKWMNAADRTESVLDSVLVECVCAGRAFRRKKMEFLWRHEPQQRALALAD